MIRKQYTKSHEMNQLNLINLTLEIISCSTTLFKHDLIRLIRDSCRELAKVMK
jgi:hypothetical protein